MIRDAADYEGKGCWVRRLLWIVGRGGEEEHTTHPNDLYPPSRVGRERECAQGSNPRPKDYRIDKQVDVLSVLTALVRGVMKVDGYRKLAIEEKGRSTTAWDPQPTRPNPRSWRRSARGSRMLRVLASLFTVQRRAAQRRVCKGSERYHPSEYQGGCPASRRSQ
jgi:hypothetical protein